LNKLAVACLVSLGIFAGTLIAMVGLSWYKNNKQDQRRIDKKKRLEEYKEELLAEQ
jgi:uncharacterized membrane-anchored protein YhcB (DUF1043 family)